MKTLKEALFSKKNLLKGDLAEWMLTMYDFDENNNDRRSIEVVRDKDDFTYIHIPFNTQGEVNGFITELTKYNVIELFYTRMNAGDIMDFLYTRRGGVFRFYYARDSINKLTIDLIDDNLVDSVFTDYTKEKIVNTLPFGKNKYVSGIILYMFKNGKYIK